MEGVKTGCEYTQQGEKYVSDFGVYPRYKITTYGGERIIYIPWEDINDPEIEVKHYSPMDIDCIYSHFRTVEDEKSLLVFAHRFGLLGLKEREDTSVALAGYSSTSQTVPFDYVDKCLEEARKLRWYIEYIRRIDTSGNLSSNPEVSRRYQETISMNLDLYPKWKAILQKASPAKQNRGDIALSVSNELGGVRPAASFTKDGTLIPGFAYLTLHDAIWHQLFITLTRQERFKECPFCHSLHTARGQFCPPPPFYKRSPCENGYYQRQHRGRGPGGKPGRPKKTIKEGVQS
ncbi:MAG: hypothetical protein ABSA82_03150 [Thermacetogeniaceae bacterium]